MKTIVTILSALAFVGAASVASAGPNDPEFGSRAFWEQMSDKG
ncbi:MAG: hypothetical protein ACLFPA_11215 [Dichotomicrobium sp.]